ncbi:MAG TPA: GTPase Era [Bacteroidales bacterium]|nr:GTPase Era [Bacteroidales bacterium]
MSHKAGFVNIIGLPNVGKSTLMNALVGEKLSITTAKAQTTRHRILGIFSSDDFQVVFSDTPGIIEPRYSLQQAMMYAVESAFEDADVFLVVTDPEQPELPEKVLEILRNSGVPVVVALNKMDLSTQEAVKSLILRWEEMLPGAAILPVSALHSFNLAGLFDMILERLPDSPAYFDKDELTDRSMRFLTAEIIREKILLLYKQEVPYSVEVVVEAFIEAPGRTEIRAVIHASRESHKMILIGKGGAAIKRLGIEARKDLEQFLDTHVYLDLSVKVTRDWRDNPLQLKRFGYDS